MHIHFIHRHLAALGVLLVAVAAVLGANTLTAQVQESGTSRSFAEETFTTPLGIGGVLSQDAVVTVDEDAYVISVVSGSVLLRADRYARADAGSIVVHAFAGTFSVLRSPGSSTVVAFDSPLLVVLGETSFVVPPEHQFRLQGGTSEVVGLPSVWLKSERTRLSQIPAATVDTRFITSHADWPGNDRTADVLGFIETHALTGQDMAAMLGTMPLFGLRSTDARVAFTAAQTLAPRTALSALFALRLSGERQLDGTQAVFARALRETSDPQAWSYAIAGVAASAVRPISSDAVHVWQELAKRAAATDVEWTITRLFPAMRSAMENISRQYPESASSLRAAIIEVARFSSSLLTAGGDTSLQSKVSDIQRALFVDEEASSAATFSPVSSPGVTYDDTQSLALAKSALIAAGALLTVQTDIRPLGPEYRFVGVTGAYAGNVSYSFTYDIVTGMAGNIVRGETKLPNSVSLAVLFRR